MWGMKCGCPRLACRAAFTIVVLGADEIGLLIEAFLDAALPAREDDQPVQQIPSQGCTKVHDLVLGHAFVPVVANLDHNAIDQPWEEYSCPDSKWNQRVVVLENSLASRCSPRFLVYCDHGKELAWQEGGHVKHSIHAHEEHDGISA